MKKIILQLLILLLIASQVSAGGIFGEYAADSDIDGEDLASFARAVAAGHPMRFTTTGYFD